MTRSTTLTPRAKEAAAIVHAAGASGIGCRRISELMQCSRGVTKQHLATAQAHGLIHRRGLGRGCLWVAGTPGTAPRQTLRINSIWQLARLAAHEAKREAQAHG